MAMPYAIKKAAKGLHDHFHQYINMQNLDENTLQRLQAKEGSELADDNESEDQLNQDDAKSLKKLGNDISKISISKLKKNIIVDQAAESLSGISRSHVGEDKVRGESMSDIDLSQASVGKFSSLVKNQEDGSNSRKTKLSAMNGSSRKQSMSK